jgi:hypothetical protein
MNSLPPLPVKSSDMRGLWFVRGNLVRDLAALNKVELLPWDIWGVIEGTDERLTQDDFTLLDEVAEIIGTQDDRYEEMRSLYAVDDRLRVPPTINSYWNGELRTVDLEEGKY